MKLNVLDNFAQFRFEKISINTLGLMYEAPLETGLTYLFYFLLHFLNHHKVSIGYF